MAVTDAWTPALALSTALVSDVLDLDGRRWTRIAVNAAIDAVDVCAGSVTVTARPTAEVLIGVLAAARAHCPVVIGGGRLTTRSRVPRDAFLVVSTSGSSAAPRRVVRTLASWTTSHDAYSALTGVAAGNRLLITGPLSSTLQLFAAVHALAVGAVVTDDPATATHAVCVPALLDRVVSCAPRLRAVVVAGARLSERAAHRAAEAGVDIAEYYGAAELSFVAARRWPTRLTAFPGVEVEIRGGELWSRSPYQASGVDGGTAGFRRGTDGFATVGDLAGRDDDGTLTIRGRGSEAILVGGRTVIVEDVEQAIASLPGVLDVAVAARPHPRLGATLVALVVHVDGASIGPIREQARTALEGEWFPRRWRAVTAIPRTTGGKIDRRALRETIEP